MKGKGSMNNVAIELRGITKRFGSVVANSNVNLTVCNGEILANNKQLIFATVSDYRNDGTAANKTMTMNFTNVKFGVQSGSSISNYLIKYI